MKYSKGKTFCFAAIFACATSLGALAAAEYVNDMDYVLGDAKQAFIQDKISTESQVDNLLIGFREMGVNGIRIPIFAAGLEPNKTMLDYFVEQAAAQGFRIFANPAQSSGGHRVACGILNGDLYSVYDDPVATQTLIDRTIEIAQEYPCTWINPFNEDGAPGMAWSAEQMNAIYSTLAAADLNGAELIGPCVWGLPGSLSAVEGTDILDYVGIASAHNLGFHHTQWPDFIALANAKGLTVWDTEVNHYDKYGTGTRLEAAIEYGVDGLVLYNTWSMISLTDGSINSTAETWKSLYWNRLAVPNAESFEDGLGAWTQSSDDDFDWTRNSGGTPTDNTGPAGASDGSHYLYIEPNDVYGVHHKVAQIECAIDLSSVSGAELTFDYHMYGVNIDYLSVDLYDGSSWTSNVWTRTGAQHSSNDAAWSNAVVSLADYAGNDAVTIRFRAKELYWHLSDIAIDNIGIEEVAVSQYDEWALVAFADAPVGTDATASGNPDGDRFSNAQEWALVTDPLVADFPALQTSVSNSVFTVYFNRRDSVDTGIDVYAAWAYSLTSSVWRVDGDGLTEVSVGWDDDVETRSATVSLEDTKFIRIQLEQ